VADGIVLLQTPGCHVVAGNESVINTGECVRVTNGHLSEQLGSWRLTLTHEPDCLTRGHRPVYLVGFTGGANRLISPISHATVNDVIHPNPGAVKSSGM